MKMSPLMSDPPRSRVAVPELRLPRGRGRRTPRRWRNALLFMPLTVVSLGWIGACRETLRGWTGEWFEGLRIVGYVDGGETIIFTGCPKRGGPYNDLFSVTREGNDYHALSNCHRYLETADVHPATGRIACIERPTTGGFRLVVLNRRGKVAWRWRPPGQVVLAGFPEWSPGGEHLSCLGMGVQGEVRRGIYVIQRGGQGFLRLSPRSLQFFLARAWYPDGRAILCVFENDKHLWRVPLDGPPDVLPELGQVAPDVLALAISPDGGKVAVVDSEPSRLRVIDMREGGGLHVDTGTGIPVWDPKSCQLFYAKRIRGYEQIFVFDLKTRDRKPLTEGQVTSFDCLYTPKDEVFFVRKSKGGASLWRMRPDGTDQRCLVSRPPPREARAPK